MRTPAGLCMVTALAATSLALSATPASAAIGAGPAYVDGRYIVTFEDEAVAGYDGYAAGFPATRPRRGAKIDRDSAAVVRWQRHLVAKHDAALAKVGADKIYDYTATNNGIAAQLTGAQAARMAKIAGVVAVVRDRLAQPDTTLSPHFLGLDAAGGIWSQLGGAANAGAGVVVGVLDTGIWPESAAFAGQTGIPVPSSWHGACIAGERFSVKTCNDKLVGARYYTAGFGIKNIQTAEFLSARDGDGHGSHTASTAAGNTNTTVSIDGVLIGTGSGMAPGAKVAAYKVCWEGRPPLGAGCFDSDSVAAINDAILDGVDVLNYSLGLNVESSPLDPVAEAFRGASNANVYVATAAGNEGPGASTLDNPAPWVTTVAAATFRRAFGVVELGNGARYLGASATPSLPAATPLVTSVSAKLAAAPADDARLCVPGSLDPAKAARKVVQCDRGVVARVAKSFEVQRAGGVGMVLTNTSADSLVADYNPIPSVHVDELARAEILDYIAAGGASATAKIVPPTAAELESFPDVPEIAEFSSRGPSTTTGGDILKPDIAAPGVDVVAAVAPPTNSGRLWDVMSGTSMASPHIAGIGALIMAKHPTWLPSEIKSALMTSAGDTVSSAQDPFAQGAGFVNPNGAADPGLVYPTTATEYRRYLVGLGASFAPPFDTLTAVGGSDLNQASIAIGSLYGAQTVTRRVKNVDTTTATFAVSATVPGFDVDVTPSAITLAPGAEQTFSVRFTRTDATLGEWAIGSLSWGGAGHVVRSPIAVRPVALSAPAEVRGDGASGSEEFQVTPGFTGSLDSSVAGLVGVTPASGSVAAGPFDFAAPAADADTRHYAVVVAAGAKAARFSLDSADDAADLDVYVYRDGVFVDFSATEASDEQVTVMSPAAGTYDVYVNGYATPGGSSAYGLANFVVGADDAGNATVTPDPASATVAVPLTLTAAWTGLDTTKRWLGVISYAGADDVTLLSVG